MEVNGLNIVHTITAPLMTRSLDEGDVHSLLTGARRPHIGSYVRDRARSAHVLNAVVERLDRRTPRVSCREDKVVQDCKPFHSEFHLPQA